MANAIAEFPEDLIPCSTAGGALRRAAALEARRRFCCVMASGMRIG
jgi:hypothetical protein